MTLIERYEAVCILSMLHLRKPRALSVFYQVDLILLAGTDEYKVLFLFV